MECVISNSQAVPELTRCSDGRTGAVGTDAKLCTWGSPSAPTRVVLVGDSIALAYNQPLLEIALNSGGQVQVQAEWATGCEFVNDLVVWDNPSISDNCPARKQHVIDTINTTKPDVVIVSNTYVYRHILGTDRTLSAREWAESMRQIVEKFRDSTKKIVFLAPPPADKDVYGCYGKRSSTPADCISRVTSEWHDMAKAEQDLAESIGGTWVDSRPWFCNAGLCPSFVGSTPTKHDYTHMTPEYGQKVYPVIEESLRAAGVF